MNQLKFDWNEFRNPSKVGGGVGETGILCKTKEESELFCIVATQHGVTWIDGESLIGKPGEHILKDNVFKEENPGIIYFAGVLVGTNSLYTKLGKNNYNIIPLKEILNENEFEVDLI